MWRMSTRTHGLIDYITGATMMALPAALGMKGKAAALLMGAGGAAAAYSALTNYERGVAKVLPVKAHLTLDALSGGMLIGAAMLMDDEDEETRGLLAGFGAFEIAAALMTETRSSTERRDSVRKRIGSESTRNEPAMAENI